MVVNVETIKLNVNDQTIILDILPEMIQESPPIILNRNSPKKTIARISIKEIMLTIKMTGLSSAIKLSRLLNLSETLWSRTLENDVATNARGTDNNNFARSKKPADSDEKNLLMKIGGNIKLHVLINAGRRLNFGKSLYFLNTYLSLTRLIDLNVSPFLNV